MIGAEGGSRTRTSLRTTDFKSASGVLTSHYYALPSRILLTFQPSKQATSRLVSAHNPLIFPSSFVSMKCRYWASLSHTERRGRSSPALKQNGQVRLTLIPNCRFFFSTKVVADASGRPSSQPPHTLDQLFVMPFL